MRRCLVVAALVVASPALAGQAAVDLPAGRLGDAVLALGRQSGTSIVVGDPGLWARRVPAVRGRMSAREALDRLAVAANADIVAAGPLGWRLVARAPRIAPVRTTQPKRVPVAASAEVGPDIIVTGSKRDVRLRDFAGQVALLDGVDLALGGAGGTEAILARLASVSSTHLGAGRNKLFIRGIADSSFTGPTQTTVGQYFGDLRLSYNAPDPDLRLYDIASVEVLEGPQGTLYGAGSLGGIIRTVPNVPEIGAVSASIAGGISAMWHGDPGADLGATLNVPLGDRVALRVVGYGVREGGYIDNPVLDRRDVNRTQIGGGRAALRLDAGNGWTVDLGGIGQWTKGDDSQYADRDEPSLTRGSAIVQGFSADYTMGQVVVSGAIGGLKVKSSTGIVGQTLTERYDATPDDSPWQPARVRAAQCDRHDRERDAGMAAHAERVRLGRRRQFHAQSHPAFALARPGRCARASDRRDQQHRRGDAVRGGKPPAVPRADRHRRCAGDAGVARGNRRRRRAGARSRRRARPRDGDRRSGRDERAAVRLADCGGVA
jgi:iron complex outermembrane receptor protein